MLRLYNTLIAKKEDFQPLEDKHVRMYVCGPTVYDYDHLGHARTYLAFDLLNRYLHFLGYKVTYIQNITDVGHLVNDAEVGADKVQQKAHQTDQSVSQVVEHFTQAHLEDMKRLHILMPDKFPRASEHIKDIITHVTGLINRGFGYVSGQGNVYFSVSRDKEYGKLSRRGLTEIITGTRTEPASDKRSPADFALWKSAPVSTSEMTWESPWGRGYPGWHIECSVMSRKYLGDTFDIHGSAVEHVFPHHENEIAQTECLTDKPMARFWVHSGMLSIHDSKMSKSLHNMILIREALREYSANELRLAFYQTQYRKPFDFNPKVMEQGVALRKKIFLAYEKLPETTDQQVWKEIVEAMNDDLDSPKALQIWGDNVDKISKKDTQKLFGIFGLYLRHIEDDEVALKLAKEREGARARKDFLTADNRKAEIMQRGFEVLDSPVGTQYLSR